MPPAAYRIFLLTCTFCLLLTACKTKKEIVYSSDNGDFREELLDTLVISDVANPIDSIPKVYNPSATRTIDILHTKLDLKFDWGKKFVLGKAWITFVPYFRSISDITLDAVGFDIHSVTLMPGGQKLPYDYDAKNLRIKLDRSYSSKEKVDILIDYTAKPDENQESFSEAITSDKGLFFIDPMDTDPDMPTQIWTQGETENNSRWFPTFDKPNERFTQEIILTVDDKYVTLSNGKKISSIKNSDGTRTDHWKQDKPHAPYLAMIAVGDYHVETDQWNGIPLQYYVEKNFSKYAKNIFNHTPEMLSFFSGKLHYPYPWDKYSQVVVREFVSGAMENTGAVVFGDFIQKTDRELIDNENDYIIAHEMMHHWFGDLVTCESWSNLTLNEGFANYAEYLWFEYKYGKDRAEYHRINEMNGYFSQIFEGGGHPLIHYHYANKEQMFDAHSYNKGGLVLHMLRQYVGDEAFFASLNKYLNDHAFTAVEVDELRMAFEDTTGEDLHWFFDQWFLGTGHPYLDVKYTYNDENKVLLIEVDQSKTPKGFYPLFRLPVDIALYFADGSVELHPIIIEEKNQRILIEDLKEKPVSYVFDGHNVLLAMINENKTTDQYKAQFRLSTHLNDKITAFTSTGDGNPDLIQIALKDQFYIIRSMAINAISDSNAVGFVSQFQDMALTDKHSEVRKAALLKLLNIEDYDAAPICKLILDSELAYPVIQIALEVVGLSDPEKASYYLNKFKKEDSDFLAGTLLGIMADDKAENLDYLESKAKKIGIYHLFDFYSGYQDFLADKKLSTLERTADFMALLAGTKDGNTYRKYLAMSTLIKIAEIISSRSSATSDDNNDVLFRKVSDMIAFIAKNETNPMLKSKYEGIK